MRLSAVFRHGGGHAQRVWFEFPTSARSCLTEGLEPFVLAFLFPAMAEGRPVRVRGRVAPSLLANLDRYMAVWSAWRPGEYRPVEFLPDDASEPPPRAAEPPAIMAFSGGLDSSCTLWRHARGLAEGPSRRIEAGVFVHGFDIPLRNRAGFDAARRRNEETLGSLGAGLIPLATNYRALNADWRDSHGAAVATVLSLFAGRYGSGLIAAAVPRGVPVTSFGSLETTDPLLSCRAFEIVHDGADLGRVDKARVLAAWPLARRNLRVCWEGPDPASNCGVCEKCIRTILEFRIAGCPCPPAFPADVSDGQIRCLRIDETYRRRILARILAEAEKAGFGSESWADAMREALAGATDQAAGARLREWRRRAAWLSPARRVIRALRGY